MQIDPLPSLPKPPVAPAGNPPRQEDFPSIPAELTYLEKRQRSTVRAYNDRIREVQREFNRLNPLVAKWNNYKDAVERYNASLAPFREKASQHQKLVQTRLQSRRAVLLYLVEMLPSLNLDKKEESIAVARAQKSEILARLTNEQRQVYDSRATAYSSPSSSSHSNVSSTSSQSHYNHSPSSDSGSDFMFYALTGNPLFLINRDIAVASIIWDQSLQPKVQVTMSEAPSGESGVPFLSSVEPALQIQSVIEPALQIEFPASHNDFNMQQLEIELPTVQEINIPQTEQVQLSEVSIPSVISEPSSSSYSSSDYTISSGGGFGGGGDSGGSSGGDSGGSSGGDGGGSSGGGE